MIPASTPPWQFLLPLSLFSLARLPGLLRQHLRKYSIQLYRSPHHLSQCLHQYYHICHCQDDTLLHHLWNVHIHQQIQKQVDLRRSCPHNFHGFQLNITALIHRFKNSPDIVTEVVSKDNLSGQCINLIESANLNFTDLLIPSHLNLMRLECPGWSTL